jgi:ElaA protein
MMQQAIQWHWRAFEALSTTDLYRILQLRSQVFVLEQAIAYQDIDDLDLHAIHVCGFDADAHLVAYARCIPAGLRYPVASLGRVVTAATVRGSGLGHALVRQGLACIAAHLGNGAVRISAQSHLQGFYSQHGFVAVGDEYLEEAIWHRAMERPAPQSVPQQSALPSA